LELIGGYIVVELLFLPHCKTVGDKKIVLHNNNYIMHVVLRDKHSAHYSYKLYHRYRIDVNNRIGQWIQTAKGWERLQPPVAYIVGTRILITQYYLTDWDPHSVIAWKIPKLIYYANTYFRYTRHELMTRPAFLVGYALVHNDIGDFLRRYVC